MEAIDTVDGWTVNTVEAGSGSTVMTVFRQVEARAWVRQDPTTGEVTNRYAESGRDDHSAYLNDVATGEEIAIGVSGRVITPRADDTPIFDIVRAAAATTGRSVNLVLGNRNGLPAMLFRRIAPATWVEERPEGGAALNTYDQVSADDTTVVLHDGSRDLRIEIDLADRRIGAAGDPRGADYDLAIAETGIGARPSAASDQPSELVFENSSTVDVDVLWVDFIGNELPRGGVAPGGSLTVSTFMGHVWVVRERLSRRKIIGVEPDTSSERVVVTTDGLRSTGGVEVDVAFKNLYTRPVELIWLGVDDAHVLDNLSPGQHATVAAHAGDVITVRSKERDIGTLLVGAEPRQFRAITSGPGRRPGATVDVRNTTPLDVGLFLRLARGQPMRFHGLAPGEAVAQPMVAGEEWIVRDEASDRMVQSFRAPSTDGEIEVTTAGLRSEPTGQAVATTFDNASDLAGTLHRVDADGIEHSAGTLRPRTQLAVDGFEGDVWRFREAATGREIGLHCSTAVADPTVLLGARSNQSRTPAVLQVENRTLLRAELLWIDGDGTEHSRGIVEPWSQVTAPTFLTHPWVVREVISRIVLDFVVTRATRETIVVDATDLARPPRTGRPGEVEFHNLSGFAVDVVDLVDPTGPAIATIPADEEAIIHRHPGASFGFREPVSGSVFGTYVMGPAPQQGCEIRLVGEDSGVITELLFHNESTAEVDLFEYRNGDERLAARLDPRDDARLETHAGNVWLARERRTGMVLACTLATAVTRAVRITTDRLRPIDTSQPVDLTLVNRSGLALEVVAVALDGQQAVVSVLAPEAEIRLDSHFSQVFHFRTTDTSQDVDTLVVGEAATERYEIQNDLVSRAVRAGGLRPGEVALYPEPDHVGQPVVANCTIHDLAACGLARVGSLQLGPSTGIVAYRDAGLHGDVHDVFDLDAPTLDGTDVADGLGSFEVFTVATPARHVNTVSSDLVTAYRQGAAGLEEYRAYRAVLTFPPEVRGVTAWADEEVTVEVAGGEVTLTTGTPTNLALPLSRTLTLTIPATRVGAPALWLRTDSMRPGQRFCIEPAAGALERLSELDPGAVYDKREALGLDDDRLGADDETRQRSCAQVQQALQQLASTLPPASRVSTQPSTPRAVGMQYDAWSFDVGAQRPMFAALSPDQAAAVPLGTTADDDIAMFFEQLVKNFDRAVIRPAAKVVDSAARQVVTTVDRVGRDAATAVRDAGKAIDQNIVQPVQKAIEEEILAPAEDLVNEAVKAVNQVVDDASELVSDAIDAVSNAVDDIADAVDEVGDTLAELDDIVLAFTTQVGDEIRTVLIDTAEKVAGAVSAVVETVGGAIEGFIDFLGTALDWDNIVHTHDVILDLAEQGFQRAPEWLDAAAGIVHSSLDQMSEQISSILSSLGSQLGAIPPGRTGGSGAAAPSGPDFDWLLSEILGWLSGEEAAPDTSPEEATALEDLAAAMAEVADEIADLAGSVGGTIAAAAGQLLSSPPEQIGPRVAGLLLALVEDVATGVIRVTGALVDAVFALTKLVLASMYDLLTEPIEIPVVSDLYRARVKSPPTMLSLICLVIAVPTNIAGAASGETWPPQRVTLSGLSRSEFESTLRTIDVAVHAFKLVLDPIIILVEGDHSLPSVGVVDRLIGRKTRAVQSLSDLAVSVLDFPGYGLIALLAPDAQADELSDRERQMFNIGWIYGLLALGFGVSSSVRQGRAAIGAAPDTGWTDAMGTLCSVIGNIVVTGTTVGRTVRLGKAGADIAVAASAFVFDIGQLVPDRKVKAGFIVGGHLAYMVLVGVATATD